MKLEWAVAGLVIWLIPLGTCFVCETEREALAKLITGMGAP
jgi:hypothetical protein